MSQAITTLPQATTAASSTAAPNNLNSLTPTDFMKLMITQLQQQDPLNPTNSSALLTQMSQISNLQSNQTMVGSLQGLTLQQSIGAGGNLIGKTVQGLNTSGKQVSGIVTSVVVQNQKVSLQLDTGQQVPLSSVEQIAPAPATSAATAAAASGGNLASAVGAGAINSLLPATTTAANTASTAAAAAGAATPAAAA